MDFDPSRKHMSLETFKGNLDLMVANVMSKVIEGQEASGGPLSFDRESLMQCIESSLPHQGLYTIDNSISSHAKGLGPYFSKLPVELRNQIFTDLIVSGNPQFLGLSKATHAEGMPLIYKKGIFRVNFDYEALKREHTFGNCPEPTPRILGKIQHLSVRIAVRDSPSALKPRGEAKALSCLDMFARSPSPSTHGKCTVFIKIGPYYNARLSLDIALAIWGLTKFKMVVIHPLVDVDRSDPIAQTRQEALSELSTHNENQYYGRMRVQLQPRLGDGEMGSDGEELRLIFHPLRTSNILPATMGQEIDVEGDEGLGAGGSDG